LILGGILAVVAGAFIGLQNIFNRHLNEYVTGWIATTFVLITGSIASLIFGLIFDGMDVFDFSGMKVSYWFFGLVGIGVIYCMMQAMKRLGPTKAVLIGVIAQLIFSLIFDVTGFLILPQVNLKWEDILGVLLIIIGLFIFNMKTKFHATQ